MKRHTTRHLFLALVLGSWFLTALQAQKSVTFTTFSVPEATNGLSVQGIDTAGVIAGFLTDSSGDTEGWMRSTDGAITILIDPLDTTTPYNEPAYEISPGGVITGYFFDTDADIYDGYFYQNGAYSTYSVPNQPAGTDSTIGGIYNRANFCGLVLQPPYTGYMDYVSINGAVTVFDPFGSTANNCFGMNSSGTAVGYYVDSAGLDHGWMRTASGTITSIDVPGASTVAGTAPCLSGNVGGSWVGGINNKGYITGHYWDKSYNEHGFVRTPAGKFITLNVPGAYQTAGGGLNNAGVMVGHWTDSSCNSSGYMATLY